MEGDVKFLGCLGSYLSGPAAPMCLQRDVGVGVSIIRARIEPHIWFPVASCAVGRAGDQLSRKRDGASGGKQAQSLSVCADISVEFTAGIRFHSLWRVLSAVATFADGMLEVVGAKK